MKARTDRILTTHTGSLPRPTELFALIKAKLAGQALDEREFAAEMQKFVQQMVIWQADIGLDVINDGKKGKPSFLY